MLQHVAVCRGDLRESCFIELEMDDDGDLTKVVKACLDCCSALQCVAVHCSVMNCTAPCCSVLHQLQRVILY